MDENQENHASNDNSQNTNNASDSPLNSAKQRALEALTPLIGSLEVDAERKFEISMSTIRLTENKDLVETALQAALAIEEKGTKAEALVELINEINYLEQA